MLDQLTSGEISHSASEGWGVNSVLKTLEPTFSSSHMNDLTTLVLRFVYLSISHLFDFA